MTGGVRLKPKLVLIASSVRSPSRRDNVLRVLASMKPHSRRLIIADESIRSRQKWQTPRQRARTVIIGSISSKEMRRSLAALRFSQSVAATNPRTNSRISTTPKARLAAVPVSMAIGMKTSCCWAPGVVGAATSRPSVPVDAIPVSSSDSAIMGFSSDAFASSAPPASTGGPIPDLHHRQCLVPYKQIAEA
ncbi:hypothetical protein ABW21_db0206278 [Orbilia brochopaga]|nr:hypothetical protein ABW21_db0206278 [Drechslerella brochopaga]